MKEKNKNILFYIILILTASFSTIIKRDKSFYDVLQILANIISLLVGGAFIWLLLKILIKYITKENIDRYDYGSRIYILSIFIFAIICFVSILFHHDILLYFYDVHSESKTNYYEINDR